jgi:hypothetical protein
MFLISSEQGPITGPLRVNPANPRYFTNDSGNSIYLTGSHTWANFQDAGYSDPPPVFDYKAYLDFLQVNRHNFFRLWTWEQSKWAPWTTENMWFSPPPYQRTGPGSALDGQPKFDLTKFDQVYFDRLRSRIIQAGDRGIYVSVMLFDGFSIDDKSAGPGNAWPGHPFNGQNNINGIDGDVNHNGMGEEVHTIQNSAITSLQEAYVRKVIDTINDLDNVLYEISNESPSNSQDWQYHMITFVKEYEAQKPKQHPVGMTVEYPDGDNAELFASPADWISPNDYFDPPESDGNKVIIADTDHIWGIGGDRQWVWKSFTRGINPIFMDCYNSNYCEGENPNNPTWVSLRLNMGYTLAYANRVDLTAMIPHGDLCSSGYCLANPIGERAEYLVYLPNGGSVDVDLSESLVNLSVEWFDPQNGTTVNAPTVTGGGTQSFFSPFSSDAVLYLHSTSFSSPTPTNTSTLISFTSTQTSTLLPVTLTFSTNTSPSSTLAFPTSTITGTSIIPTSTHTKTHTKTQTSTIPPVTQTPSTIASPTPTPGPPSTPLPCAQGFLVLGGIIYIVVGAGSFMRKKSTA